MKGIAVILVAAFAFTHPAFARDAYRSGDAWRYDGRQCQTEAVIGWDDSAGQPQKIYNWPDQRYYGQHGMMLD